MAVVQLCGFSKVLHETSCYIGSLTMSMPPAFHCSIFHEETHYPTNISSRELAGLLHTGLSAILILATALEMLA